MFCTKCGKALPDNSTVCGYCGEIMDDTIDSIENNDIEQLANFPNEDNIKDKPEIKPDDSTGGNEKNSLIDNIKNNVTKNNTAKKGNKIKQAIILPAGVQVINKKTAPLSTMRFFIMELLLLIPIVNIILLLIWGFRKNSNKNTKAFSRSILIWLLIIMLSIFAALIVMIVLGYPVDVNYWLESLKSYIISI